MECPYCKTEMINGALKCYRSAPVWKGVNGKRFSFGKAKLLVNTTEGVWFCESCDSLIVRSVGEKQSSIL